jgi:predicted MFS family arabinose efflux permease
LYGSAGQWERLQAEIAEHRARKKEQLREMERIKKRNRDIIIVTILLIIGSIAGYKYINFLLKVKGYI